MSRTYRAYRVAYAIFGAIQAGVAYHLATLSFQQHHPWMGAIDIALILINAGLSVVNTIALTR